MSHSDETFFTAVGCMDGRVQEVVAAFGREKFGAKYPDTVTEAGLVGQLAKDIVDQNLHDALQFKVVTVSIGKHHAGGVVVHGHAECAGNPVDDEKQKEDIRKSVTVIKSLVGEIPVVGVFVHRDTTDSSKWLAEEVTA
jgi:hypothetical protein